MRSSANRLPHPLTCITASCKLFAWSTHCSTLLPLLCCFSNLTLMVTVLLWCNIHLVIHVPLPVGFIVLLWCSTRFHLDLSLKRKEKRCHWGDVPKSSKLCEELLYMVGKLIGPLANHGSSIHIVFQINHWHGMTARPLKCQSKKPSQCLAHLLRNATRELWKLPLINIMNKTPYFTELHVNLLTVSAGCEGHSSNCLSQGIYGLCVQQ